MGSRRGDIVVQQVAFDHQQIAGALQSRVWEGPNQPWGGTVGPSHPPTPIGWRVNGVGIQSNTVLSYYQVFPDVDIQSITVLS